MSPPQDLVLPINFCLLGGVGRFPVKLLESGTRPVREIPLCLVHALVSDNAVCLIGDTFVEEVSFSRSTIVSFCGLRSSAVRHH
jgi:hypothetical protein